MIPCCTKVHSISQIWVGSWGNTYFLLLAVFSQIRHPYFLSKKVAYLARDPLLHSQTHRCQWKFHTLLQRSSWPLFHGKKMTIHFVIQIKIKTSAHAKVYLEVCRVSLRGYVGWKCINTIEVDNIYWITSKLNQHKEKCIWKLEESHTLHNKQ